MYKTYYATSSLERSFQQDAEEVFNRAWEEGYEYVARISDHLFLFKKRSNE